MLNLDKPSPINSFTDQTPFKFQTEDGQWKPFRPNGTIDTRISHVNRNNADADGKYSTCVCVSQPPLFCCVNVIKCRLTSLYFRVAALWNLQLQNWQMVFNATRTGKNITSLILTLALKFVCLSFSTRSEVRLPYFFCFSKLVSRLVVSQQVQSLCEIWVIAHKLFLQMTTYPPPYHSIF